MKHRNHSPHLTALALATAVAIIAGCASDNHQPAICAALDDPEDYTETHDPMEPFNRSVYDFNVAADKAILEPVARSYQKNVPILVRNRVTDFTNFLKEPRNLASTLMRGKLQESAQVTLRIATNAVLGIAGTVDIAGHAGIEYRNHTFGDAFAHWGIGDGPYVVVPFFGPTNARDGTGNLVRHVYVNTTKRISSSDLQLGTQTAGIVNNRARLLPLTDVVEQQPDPYIFVRESYRQNRLNQICNP